jgi:hypothetical protein
MSMSTLISNLNKGRQLIEKNLPELIVLETPVLIFGSKPKNFQARDM